MSILAAIVDWNGSPPLERLRALLAGFPERTPDGCSYADAPHALMGFGRRVVRRAERGEVQPLKDVPRGTCVVGDVRLDNRDELRRELSDGDRRLATDIELLAAGYERWGTDLARRLVGDFAFVIWDWRRRLIFAARDPFGVRALLYRSMPHGLIFATDASQLLALPDTERTPDDQIVVDALSWSYAHYGPSYFRAIRSVRPGHYLEGLEGSIREVEYFHPPDEDLRLGGPEEYRERFRALFEVAVRDRLDAESPILAHLSGGLDSSSIVCMADQIYGKDPSARPPLITASALFPGQPHDERPFVEAVTGVVRFTSRTWDGSVASGREFSRPGVAFPGVSVVFNGGSTGDLEIARQDGCRVLLSGEGGDAVTGEAGLFNDLIRRGMWWALGGQIAAADSAPERSIRIRMLKRALREEVPRGVAQLWDRRRGPQPVRSPPSWLRQELRPLWIDRRAWFPPREGRWSSRLQRDTWGYLRWSRLSWVTDAWGQYAADSGIEVRFPFLDSRLVQFVLSVPFEQRLIGPCRRWLHREALRAVLPPAIADRCSKANFNQAIIGWGTRCVESIREIIESPRSHWLSDRFVDQKQAQALLDRVADPRAVDGAGASDAEGWLALRSIVHLELWHRAVLRYSPPQESLPMSNVTKASERTDDPVAAATPPGEYVPPKLTGIGNVRELLAGTNLSGNDGAGAQTQDGPPG